MKNGFTLIELIMVILILGIIALITVPTVNSVIKDSREKSYNNQVDLITDTARTYMSDHSENLPSQSGGEFCVTVAMMQKDGLLSKDDIVNPNYKEGSSEPTEKAEYFNDGVLVTWNGNKYTYTYGDC